MIWNLLTKNWKITAVTYMLVCFACCFFPPNKIFEFSKTFGPGQKIKCYFGLFTKTRHMNCSAMSYRFFFLRGADGRGWFFCHAFKISGTNFSSVQDSSVNFKTSKVQPFKFQASNFLAPQFKLHLKNNQTFPSNTNTPPHTPENFYRNE